MVSEGVDSAHDTLGGVEEGLVGGSGEERAVEAGDLEPVFEVEAGGVAIEAAQSEADGDALCEGLEVRQAQDLPQSGLAGQEHGEPALGIPVEVGEQGKKGEDVGAQVLGFVDDDQNREVSVVDEALDLVLDQAHGHGP